MMVTFKDLEVWERSSQLAMDLCVAISDTRGFTLKDQLQQTVIAIPACIAKGTECSADKDFMRFLLLSKDSCDKLRTQIYIYNKLSKILGKPIIKNSKVMVAEARELSAMLQGLVKTIQARQSKKDPES